MDGLLSLDEALARVVSRAAPLPAEEVAIGDALGRVLAADAKAAVDLPPFDSSAMDGYAVRAAETPGELRIAGASAAGRPAGSALRSGEAFEISTGAVVPEGADAVVPVEATRLEGGTVTVDRVEPGANIRPRGGDARAGSLVVARGTRLRAAHVGAAAAAGLRTVSCTRAPRVALLATGDELRPPGTELEAGQIYESNAAMLGAALRQAGVEASVLAPAVDDAGALRDVLAEGLEADVLVTSGGVSVGPHDLVKRVLAELGVEEVFWRVAVRPGKPVFFGVRGGTLVFGLPGNPVSTLVGFELFVRPALAALQGDGDPGPRFLPGRLATGLRRSSSRDALVRARCRVDREVVLEPLTGQESHMIARSSAADALVLVPRGDGELEAGAHVSYLRL